MKVERNILIAAQPARVWQAWVSEMGAWWSEPYYMDAERVTGMNIEPRLGGLFVEQWGKDAGYLLGHVIEWLPPERLTCTWTEKGWAGIFTTVRLELRSEGAQTHVSLIHDGFEHLPDGAEQSRSYEGGWDDLLGKLKAHVEKRKK